MAAALLCPLGIPGQDRTGGPPSLDVHGRVIDEAGKGIEGASFLVGPPEDIVTSAALRDPTVRTDAQGRFRIEFSAKTRAGIGTQALIVAPGRTCLSVELVGEVRIRAGKAVEVVELGTLRLRPGIRIRGLVRSAEGDPIAGARVEAVDVLRSPHLAIPFPDECRSIATTDDRGRFTLRGLPPRGVSVRITAAGYQDHHTQYVNQFTPLVAQLRPSGTASGRVTVGGKPAPGILVRAYYEHSVRTDEIETDKKGRFAIPLRQPGRYRLAVKRAVPHPDVYTSSETAGRTGIEITLPQTAAVGTSVAAGPRPGVIEGVVVDTATGKPIPGALVTTGIFPGKSAGPVWRGGVPSGTGPGTPAEIPAITDAKGRFRLSVPGTGLRNLLATLPGRPVGELRAIQILAGKTKSGIRIQMGRGVTLSGRLVGAPVGEGWRIQLQEKSEQNMIFLPTSQDLEPPEPGHRVAVGRDGRFRVVGLPAGHFRPVLLIPYPLGEIRIELQDLKLAAVDLEQTFELTGRWPAKLEGQVVVAGAPVSPGRLLVVASQRKAVGRGGFIVLGPGTWKAETTTAAVVGRDGRFSMPAPVGRHAVRLIDMATGAVLFQGPSLVQVGSGKATTCDITAELALVTVDLRPAREGESMVASRLEFQIPYPKLVRNVIESTRRRPVNVDRGVGVALHPDQRQASIVLPARKLKLLARSCAYQLDPKCRVEFMAPLGEIEIQPKSGVVTRVALVVSPAAVPDGR